MTPVLRKGAWTQPNFKHLQSQARHRMSPPSPLFLHPPKLVRSSATPPEEKCQDMTRPSNECSDLFLYFPGESCGSGGLGLQWLTVSVNGRLTCLTWWLMVVAPSPLISASVFGGASTSDTSFYAHCSSCHVSFKYV